MTNHHAGSATGIDLAALEQLAREYITADESGRPCNPLLNDLQRRINNKLDPKTVLALIALARATPQHHDEGAGEVIAYMARDNRLSRPPGPDCTSPNDGWSDWHPTTKKHGESILENKRNFPENYWNWQVRPLAYADAATPQHSVTEQARAVQIFTCIDKGGEYEMVGYSNGAGPKRGDTIVVYRDTQKPDMLYHRSADDFKARMQWLGGRAPSPASTAATQPEQVRKRLVAAEEELAFCQRSHARFPITQRLSEAYVEVEAARAALAIPASTAKKEQK